MLLQCAKMILLHIYLLLLLAFSMNLKTIVTDYIGSTGSCMCFGFSASVLTYVHFIYFGANPVTLESNPCSLEISGKQKYLEGETILLTCVALIPVKNSVCVSDNCASINWTPYLETINVTSRNVSLNDSIFNNVTSTLQIPNVDQSNTEHYTCGLIVGVTNVAARGLSLTVYG